MKRERIPYPPASYDFDVLVNDSGNSPRSTVHNLGPVIRDEGLIKGRVILDERIVRTACGIRIGKLDWPSGKSIISWRLLELKMVWPCKNCWEWRLSE